MSKRKSSMKRYVRMTRPACGKQFVALELTSLDLADEFDGADVGETIVLELAEMDETEYANLPDFEGW